MGYLIPISRCAGDSTSALLGGIYSQTDAKPAILETTPSTGQLKCGITSNAHPCQENHEQNPEQDWSH